MPEIEVTAMINGWRTRMHGNVDRHNGGPRPESTDHQYPIGKTFQVRIKGTQEEISAMCEALELDVTPEIWLSRNGKFA
jgi:hypothetical protein